MAEHVFISYSRKDQTYVERLNSALHSRNVTTWLDHTIDYGARWWREIVQAIRDCHAFLPVMTPDAEESEWVEREILLALDEKKPIFPLLLRGKRNPLLIHLEYVDVSNGELPPDSYVTRLRRARSQPAPSISELIGVGLRKFPLTPLEAPKLEVAVSPASSTSLDATRLTWTPVLWAMGYVLERSASMDFANTTEVYRGDKTEFADFGARMSLIHSALAPFVTTFTWYYRVRAIGLALVAGDSAWSDIVGDIVTPKLGATPASPTFNPASSDLVEVKPRRTIAEIFEQAPPVTSFITGKPVLTGTRALMSAHLHWTRTLIMDSYILERSSHLDFRDAEVIYEGTALEYRDDGAGLSPTRYYRVGVKPAVRGIGPRWSATLALEMNVFT